MSKGFENLSTAECIPVSKALIANARSMKQSAKAVAGKGKYGPARSLLILGAEEFIKGAPLYLTGKGVRVLRVKEARKALNNHKERHEAAIVLKLLKVIEGLMALQKFRSNPQKKVT